MGGGHVHAILLDLWAAKRPADAHLTLVSDAPELIYSGMIPGLVADEYLRRDTVIDARGLARRGRARLVVDTVVEIDPVGRRLLLEHGGPLFYDVASLGVGASTKGLPGERSAGGGVSAKDAGTLVARLRALESSRTGPSVVVVGGGAAGIELAASIQARLTRSTSVPKGRPRVTLVEAGPRLMKGYSEEVSARVREAATSRGVDVRLGRRVVAAEPSTVRLEAPPGMDAGECLASDLTVRATGAEPRPFLASSGLPLDQDGFIQVDGTLRVVGPDDLFAVGDCASLEGDDVPKAGVHAVRQAPILFENLRRMTESWPARTASDALARYEPQSDFLTLLNLGDGTALGTKWGYVAEGRWVRWVKDAIDRRFVERFRG